MSTEQTTNTIQINDSIIQANQAIIAARQRELLAAEKIADNKVLEQITRRHLAFNATGITDLISATKQIRVVHPNPDFRYLDVPLQRWIRPIYVNGVMIGVKVAAATWNVDPCITWKTIITGDGKINYRTYCVSRARADYKTAKEFKSSFVDWLADIIPIHEFDGLDISELETPNVRRRVIKKMEHNTAK